MRGWQRAMTATVCLLLGGLGGAMVWWSDRQITRLTNRLEDEDLRTMDGAPTDLIQPPSFCRFHSRCPQVLERCRVEDDLGTVLVEQFEQAIAIADVGEEQVVLLEECTAVDRELHGMKAALVAVELQELCGFEAGELAAELAADRAAGAGDQHPRPMQHALHGGRVDLDRLAAQQVLDLDLAGPVARCAVREVRLHQVDPGEEAPPGRELRFPAHQVIHGLGGISMERKVTERSEGEVGRAEDFVRATASRPVIAASSSASNLSPQPLKTKSFSTGVLSTSVVNGP